MHQSSKRGFLAGLFLCAAAALPLQAASSFVKFSVDMSVEIANLTFTPGTDTVRVHGTFNGWGAGVTLVQEGTSDVYTNTINNTLEPNGATMQYKFVNTHPGVPNGGYETPWDYHNRSARLPATSGASLLLPTAYYNDAGPQTTSLVTFQVDMAQQINIGLFDTNNDTVSVRGRFNSWAQSTLTNDPTILRLNQFGQVTSNVYVGTFEETASPGAAADHKFYYSHNGDHWESVTATNQGADGNRYYFHPDVAATNPIVFFNDQPYSNLVTNKVVFLVDMSVENLIGHFDQTIYQVFVSGGFNGWPGTAAGALSLTNIPTWNGNTNIFYGTNTFVGGPGTLATQYKFTDNDPLAGNSGYELSGFPDRSFSLLQANGVLILPLVTFNNGVINDYLLEDTLVTFTVNMAGAVGSDAHVFDAQNDTVHINGDFYFSWNGGVWDITLPGLLNDPPLSSLYTYSSTFTRGKPRRVEYKYSINGDANEPGPNHIRYIRSTGGANYSMPQDTFGAGVEEPKFGNLAVGPVSAGRAPVTWLGLPGVRLQNRSSLSSGTWQDQPLTDGLGSTNWPVNGDSQFFRLIQPAP